MRRCKPLFVLIILYVIVQLIYVLFFPVPFISDSANYVLFARQAIQEGTYYPNPSSVYNAWLVAPVYMNYLIVLFKIQDHVSIILVFNILLNMTQLALVYIVTRKIFNNRVAWAAALLYMLYLNNLGLVLLNFTELMFGIFTLLSIFFYISDSTIRNNLLCGIFTGLAIGIRPTGWALVLVFLLLYVVDVFRRQAAHRRVILIFIGVMLYILPMGLLSERNIDRFEFTSTTGPANLIMTANPRAKGVYDGHFFKHDSLYLTLKTYPERDAYMMRAAKAYIREHPVEWLSLIPRKLYSTFISDGWTIEYLLGSSKWNINTYLKADKQERAEFNQQGTAFRIRFWTLNIWQQLVYGFIIILFVLQLGLSIRRKVSAGELVIYLFNLCVVGLSILGSVGNPRYKYNVIILAIIAISPLVVRIYDTRIRPMFKGSSLHAASDVQNKT